MTKQKQAALAGAAVAAVSADLAKDHIQGLFTEFRAEGRHIFGTLEGGKEVKITQYVNGGAGLDTEELASTVADKLNMDEMMASLVGIALQFDFRPDGYSEKPAERKAA